jgi:hypothetical protein
LDATTTDDPFTESVRRKRSPVNRQALYLEKEKEFNTTTFSLRVSTNAFQPPTSSKRTNLESAAGKLSTGIQQSLYSGQTPSFALPTFVQSPTATDRNSERVYERWYASYIGRNGKLV